MKGMQKGMAKGSGKGFKGKAAKPVNKYQEKLKKIDNSKLVWVGNLSKKTTWKALEKHFATVLKPTVSDIKTKGGKITAIVAFKSEEDVATVCDALNGSELDGNVLEVDKWVKDESIVREKKPKKKVLNTKFAKKPTDKKTAAKLKETKPECKVWVGGLAEKTTWKALEKHFTEFKKPKVTEIMRKGMACVCYESEEDVAGAIAALAGTEIDGKTLELDTWVKPEKKEKEAKPAKKGKEAKEEAKE